jgi:hypothetical protein
MTDTTEAAITRADYRALPRHASDYGRAHHHMRRPARAAADETRQAPMQPGSPFVWPRNETEFRQALESAADERYVVMLDPRTQVEISQTITISQPGHDGTIWGVNGNHAKLAWAGGWGEDMLVFRGVKGVANRGLFIEKLGFFGNGWGGAAAGSCLKLFAPEGDPGSIYKFTLRDIFTSYATHGVTLQGAVFEGLMENVHGENHRGDGIHMEHTFTPGEHKGIVSNIMIIHPNCSRNFGAGVRPVNSTNMILGSFILNAEGGVVAPEGLRCAALCNGENTGESVFVVPWAGWGSAILYNEGSTDRATVARRWENDQWVDVGKPALYVLDGHPDVVEVGNHISAYGEVTEPPVAVVKPRE